MNQSGYRGVQRMKLVSDLFIFQLYQWYIFPFQNTCAINQSNISTNICMLSQIWTKNEIASEITCTTELSDHKAKNHK